MENKRIYTEEDAVKFAMLCREYPTMPLWDNEVIEYFDKFGQPYEPATPAAPSMSDEDKVFWAALLLHLKGWDEPILAIGEGFDFVDYFNEYKSTRQKEREGLK